MMRTTSNLPRVTYSIQEFAAMTGLSLTRVFTEMREGTLRTVKSGRRTLITAEEVETWMKGLVSRKAS